MEFLTPSALRPVQPSSVTPAAATAAAATVPPLSLMPPPPLSAATPDLASAAAVPFGMFSPPTLAPGGIMSTQAKPPSAPHHQKSSPKPHSSNTAVTPPALMINAANPAANNGFPSNSSFAAALRNLAKNATGGNVNNNNNNVKESTARCVPVAASKKGHSSTAAPAAVPQMTNILPPPPPPPSLIDVRKGFGRADNATSSSLSSATTTSPSSSSSSSTPAAASGFQPYKPDLSPIPKNPAEASSPYLSAGIHPAYAGYHHLYAGVSPYSLDMESLYRSQLERYMAAVAAASGGANLQQQPQQPTAAFPSSFAPPPVPQPTTTAATTKTSTPALSSLLSSPIAHPTPTPIAMPTTTTAAAATTASKSSKRKSDEATKERKRIRAEENRAKARAANNSSSNSGSKEIQPPPQTTTASALPPSASPYANMPYFPMYSSMYAFANPYLTPTAQPQTNGPKSSWEQALESLTVSQQQSIHAAAAAAAVATAGSNSNYLNPLLYAGRPLLPPPSIPAQISANSNLVNGTPQVTSSAEAIKLPTEPLDRSEVSPPKKAKVSSKNEDAHKNKRLFVRPFEDDFKKDGKASGENKDEEAATLHYGDDVRVKLPISSLQGRQQQEHILNRESDRGSDNVDGNNVLAASASTTAEQGGTTILQAHLSKSGDGSSLSGVQNAPPPPPSEPPESQSQSKDNLRYLRYFRLMTHRKKSSDGSSSHDRNTALSQTKPKTGDNNSDVEDDVDGLCLSDLRGRKRKKFRKSRSLPPPPPSGTSSWLTGRLEPDSPAKIVFMSQLGLWRMADADKIDHEECWNLALDERLNRGPNSNSNSKNKITEYLVRLRSSDSHDRKPSCDSAFLDPQLLGTETQSIASYNQTRIQQQQRQSVTHQIPKPSSSPNLNSATTTTTQLPILLSTLLPLPLSTSSASSSSSSPPRSVLMGDASNECTIVGGVSKKRVPIVAWPGVEAIAESYKNYSKDCLDEKRVLESRMRELQQDVLERRAAVDALAARLANLSRLRRFQDARRAADEAAFKAAARLVMLCTRDDEPQNAVSHNNLQNEAPNAVSHGKMAAGSVAAPADNMKETA